MAHETREFKMLPISPAINDLKQFPTKDGDIFIASWPKSGELTAVLERVLQRLHRQVRLGRKPS